MKTDIRTNATRMLVAGAVALIGGIIAASTAFAYPAAPANIDIDSNANVVDNFVNSNEVTAVRVTGTVSLATPPVDAVRVQIVNSATCSTDAPQTSQVSATLTGTTWQATFSVSGFAEGAILCARARASNDGLAFGSSGKVYGPTGTSNDFPMKDTVVNAGTITTVDPRDDGFLNKDEADGGTVSSAYTSANSDATKVAAWYGPAGSATAYGHADCGTVPATLAAYGSPPTGNKGLTAACAGAIPEGDTLSLNARWADGPGNFSAIASSTGSLVKDTTAPAQPVSTIITDPITSSNQGAIHLDVTAEADATVNVDLNDGDTHLSQRREPPTATDPPAPMPWRFTFVANSLADCNDSDVDPDTGTPIESSILPKCISAEATATDLAGNVSAIPTADTGDTDPDGLDEVFKDAAVPAAPVLHVVPSNVQAEVDTIVEIEVEGAEDFATANLTIADEDPATADIARTYNTFGGSPTVYVDVETLTDGLLNVRATLTDGVGNRSAVGTTTATKGIRLSAPNVPSGDGTTVTITRIPLDAERVVLTLSHSDHTSAPFEVEGPFADAATQIEVPKAELDEIGTYRLTAVARNGDDTAVGRGVGSVRVLDPDCSRSDHSLPPTEVSPEGRTDLDDGALQDDPEEWHPVICVAWKDAGSAFFSGHPVNPTDPSNPCGELWIASEKRYDSDGVDRNGGEC